MPKKQMKLPKIDYRTEIIAAFTTFFTMAYILVVNPRILSDAGLPFDAVFTVTALAAGIGCIIMGLRSDKPLAVASGMGLNAYFAYTAVIGMGISWAAALAAVFASSALIFLIAVSRVNFSDAIPASFKHALIAGLGLFLVFIGMQNAHFVVTDKATIVALGDLAQPQALIAVLGFFITAFLVSRGVSGALFIAVVLTTVAAMIIGIAAPPAEIFGLPPTPEPLLMKLDFNSLLSVSLFPVIWTLFIISFFDIVGTNIALLTKAGYVEKGGKVKGFRKALEACGLSGMIGALFGATSIVTYLESATGIEAGGRRGITAIGVGVLFLVSLFFFPLIKAIPIEAASAAIIVVGLFMLSSIEHIKLSDKTEAIPALLTLGAIPFTFSISHGIAVGSISYVFLKLMNGKWKEVHPAMYLISFFSVLEFAHVF